MRNRVLSMVILMLVIGAGSGAAQGVEYPKLLDKVKAGDTGVDFKAMRLAAAASSQFAAMTIDSKLRLKLIEAAKAKKFDEIAKLSQEMLKANFLDMNAHVYAATAYQALKDQKKADFHQAVYVGLINSIVGSANGESPATAYEVISADEVYSVLNAFELQKTAVENSTIEGRNYQIVTAMDKVTNSTTKIYFNVDLIARSQTKPAK